MRKSNNEVIFKGVIPPMVTPLTSDLKLDKEGLSKLLLHLIDGGVHGIFVLGTTGESVSLSYELRAELIRETCNIVKERVPVLVGITDTSIAESVSLANVAFDAGANAVVAAPPYYFSSDQEDLYNYYWSLADKVKLPLFLYNMPALTKDSIAVETAVRLSKHQNIIGLKDSSGNGAYFQSLCFLLKNDSEFTLLVGSEEMMAETVLMNGDGGVTGGANLFPELYVALYEAAAARDLDRVMTLQKMVMEVGQLVYNVSGHRYGNIKGLKAALSILNIINPTTHSPLRSLDESEIAKFALSINAMQLTISEKLNAKDTL